MWHVLATYTCTDNVVSVTCPITRFDNSQIPVSFFYWDVVTQPQLSEENYFAFCFCSFDKFNLNNGQIFFTRQIIDRIWWMSYCTCKKHKKNTSTLKIEWFLFSASFLTYTRLDATPGPSATNTPQHGSRGWTRVFKHQTRSSQCWV